MAQIASYVKSERRRVVPPNSGLLDAEERSNPEPAPN